MHRGIAPQSYSSIALKPPNSRFGLSRARGGLSTLSLELGSGRFDRCAERVVAPILAPRATLPATQSLPSAASARSLDWFTFFLADIQTGFGPFVAIYLTAHAWTQFDIGLVLTAGGLVAKRCYANTLRPRSRMLLKVMKGG